jgi:hypothetical protein
MRNLDSIRRAVVVIAIVTMTTALATAAQAQVSVTYDLLPYQKFDDTDVTSQPAGDTAVADQPRVQLRKLRASVSYPVVLVRDKTVLINGLSYQLIEFRYRNLTYPLERLHSASYTAMLQHRLSRGWSVWAMATPSLASDLRTEVSEKDFTFQAGVIGIRHFGESFALGLGVAYTNQFGSGEVLPVVGFDWNNGRNLTARAIVPTSLEFWYRPNATLDLGVVVSGDGNNFHGDPDLYQVVDPQLRYTMLTAGPAARIKLIGYLRLTLEGGIIGLHRFEFFDGDNKADSVDLKSSAYGRFGLAFGP